MNKAIDFREKQASAALRLQPDSSHTNKYAADRTSSQALHLPAFDKNREVRAKKSLGQHFLTDLNIARKIAEAIAVPVNDNGSYREPAGEVSVSGTREVRQVVLEIGGGMGVLTQFLLERDDITLWGIEIDRESIAYMRGHFPEFATGGSRNGGDSGYNDKGDGGDRSEGEGGNRGDNDEGRLIEGDFLKFDLRARFPGGVNIVGNFPYNISSQIFFKVLENRDLVPEVVGMVQREVAVRIAEPPGSRAYGIMSVLLQAWYDIEYLFTVSESVFSPPPKVKSAVIRLRRNSTVELGCDESLFVKVVKASFGQRRKMLRNSLRSVFGDFGGAEHPFFSRRAEQLSVTEFVELTNWVAEHTK